MSDTEELLPQGLTIAAVERDTRIGKDTLRVWERRYGFPQPGRDAHGERVYPPDQVERLRHIKRLLDAGLRPGRVVAMPLDELLRHAEESAGEAPPPASDLPDSAESTAARAPSPEVEPLMLLLRAHELQGLRRGLSQALLRRGLAGFVTGVAVPLLGEVGAAWSRGQLEIYEEHLCSEVLETVLRSALASAPPADRASRPRVVLSTFPGEQHGLGLLMADALLTVEGCWCMNLGRQTPMRDLLRAVQAHRAQVIALSFSAANNPNQVLDGLLELRRQTDPEIEIWAGVPFTHLLRRSCAGVHLLTSLADIPAGVQRWLTHATCRHGLDPAQAQDTGGSAAAHPGPRSATAPVGIRGPGACRTPAPTRPAARMNGEDAVVRSFQTAA
jgi:DNA-binding transcriptional MerR regulator/methylmalonyl-CoA mutase cobalamin-binding subunit